MLASFVRCPPVAPASLCPVEVFRTNVGSVGQGAAVVRSIHQRFPTLQATLDLDDCDRVLRVQSRRPAGPALWAQVMQVVRRLGVRIEVLPE